MILSVILSLTAGGILEAGANVKLSRYLRIIQRLDSQQSLDAAGLINVKLKSAVEYAGLLFVSMDLMRFPRLLLLLLATALFCGAPHVVHSAEPSVAAIEKTADDKTQKAIDAVAGFWLTQDKDGTVEIYACGDQVCGRFHWLQQDSADAVSRDFRNPDPEKQSRPLCELQFMGGFIPGVAGGFENGWIYSPRHGAVFSARMTLVDANTLDLHGYLLTPLLGESQIWHRTSETPSCKTVTK